MQREHHCEFRHTHYLTARIIYAHPFSPSNVASVPLAARVALGVLSASTVGFIMVVKPKE